MLVDVSPQEAQVLAALGVACAALLAAWSGSTGGFVWDDRAALLSNADVLADGRGSSLADLFTHDFWGLSIRSADSHKSFRPLTVLSFRLNHLLAGGHNPAAYHVTNTLIHAGCAALVWKLASVLFTQHYKRLTAVLRPREQATASSVSNDNPQDAAPVAKHSVSSSMDAIHDAGEDISPGALAASLLFAVHPVHCDAIASIVGRADLLCTLLSLSAFLLYVRAAEDKREGVKRSMLAVALLLTLAASLCKELGFTTFGLLLIYDLLQIPIHRSMDPRLHSLKTRVAAIVSVGLAAAALRVWVNGEHRQMEWNILANNVAVLRDAKLVKLLSYAHLHAWYLWKLVWPRWLCFDYGFNTVPVISGITDVRNLYTLLAYATVFVGCFAALRQFRGSPSSSLLFMSISFGVIPFVPASNIFFPVGTVVAERLLYFPSVGFCLLVGFIIDRALAITRKYVVLNTLKEENNSRANHTELFFRASRRVILICSALILASGCYRSHVRNLEWVSEDALFDAALEVAPTNVKVLCNAAKGLLNSNPQQAVRYLSVALGLLPQHIESHTNLGLAYSTLSSSLAASAGSASNESDALFLHCVRHLYKAAELAPTIYPAPGFLGGELLSHWTNTHREHNGGHSMQQLLSSETVANAARFLDLAIAGNSVYPTHYFHRANLAYEAGELDAAISFLRASEEANTVIRERQLDPELLVEPASIYNMLSVCYKRKGELDKALRLLLQAIELYPGEPDLHANAAIMFHERGQREESDQQLRASLQAATDSSDARKLRHIAQVFEGQSFHGAAQAFIDRATELQHQFS